MNMSMILNVSCLVERCKTAWVAHLSLSMKIRKAVVRTFRKAAEAVWLQRPESGHKMAFNGAVGAAAPGPIGPYTAAVYLTGRIHRCMFVYLPGAWLHDVYPVKVMRSLALFALRREWRLGAGVTTRGWEPCLWCPCKGMGISTMVSLWGDWTLGTGANVRYEPWCYEQGNSPLELL